MISYGILLFDSQFGCLTSGAQEGHGNLSRDFSQESRKFIAMVNDVLLLGPYSAGINWAMPVVLRDL